MLLADPHSPLKRRLATGVSAQPGPRSPQSPAIPDGEEPSVPIKLLGEIGFYNLKSLLVLVVLGVLVVPVAAMDVVKAQFAAELAAGEAAGPRPRPGAGGGTVAEFAVRLKLGMRNAVPLGTWG